MHEVFQADARRGERPTAAEWNRRGAVLQRLAGERGGPGLHRIQTGGFAGSTAANRQDLLFCRLQEDLPAEPFLFDLTDPAVCPTSSTATSTTGTATTTPTPTTTPPVGGGAAPPDVEWPGDEPDPVADALGGAAAATDWPDPDADAWAQGTDPHGQTTDVNAGYTGPDFNATVLFKDGAGNWFESTQGVQVSNFTGKAFTKGQLIAAAWNTQIGQWIVIAAFDGPVPVCPTTTTTPCGGTITWAWDDTNKTWTQQSTTCGAGCVADPPQYCGSVGPAQGCQEKSTTFCHAGLPAPSVCCPGTTTTTPPPTTTTTPDPSTTTLAPTTTTVAGCSSGCDFRCEQGRWIKYVDNCYTPGCGCAWPSEGCTECYTVHTPCTTSTTTTPAPYCTGSCSWYWSVTFGTWQKTGGGCATNQSWLCVCDTPSTVGDQCAQQAITLCHWTGSGPAGGNSGQSGGGGSTGTTQVPCTTSTTVPPGGNCAGGSCYWQWTPAAQGGGAGNWTMVSNNCGANCYCGVVPTQGGDPCETTFTACQASPPPTTTTYPPTTTSTTPAPTTTSTTGGPTTTTPAGGTTTTPAGGTTTTPAGGTTTTPAGGTTTTPAGGTTTTPAGGATTTPAGGTTTTPAGGTTTPAGGTTTTTPAGGTTTTPAGGTTTTTTTAAPTTTSTTTTTTTTQAMATISGTVTKDGAPYPGAAVQATVIVGGGGTLAATAGGAGNYTTNPGIDGQYQVQAVGLPAGCTSSTPTVQLTPPANLTGVNITVTCTTTTTAPTTTTTSTTTTTTTTAPLAVPHINSISPTSGNHATSSSFTISGTGFVNVTAVKFGTYNAASYTVNNSGSITAMSPVMSAGGGIMITVANAAGTSNGVSVSFY